MGMEWKYVLAAAFVFAVISVIATRGLIVSDGYWKNIDYTPRFDVTSFREYFFTLFKWDERSYFDYQKRIVLEWVYLFISEGQEQAVRFTALAFVSLFSAYLVCNRLLARANHAIGPARMHAIGFICGFFYLVNPIAVSQFSNSYFAYIYAIFPLLFYSIYMTLDSEKTRYPAMLGLISAFSFLLVIHSALYAVAMFIGIFCAQFAARRDLAWAKGAAARCAIAAAVFIALTAFILLPVLGSSFISGLPHPGYVTSDDYVATLAKNSVVFRLMSLDIHFLAWEHLVFEYPFGGLPYYPAVALLFGAAIMCALLKPNRLILAALACLCIFVIVGKSINPPFGNLYGDAIFDLPFIGWIFRGGQKFAYMIPFFFTLVLGNMLASVKDRMALAGIGIAILLMQSLFVWPIWTGDLDGQIAKAPAPRAILDAASILKNDGDYKAKVVWYSDYPESSPIKTMPPYQGDQFMWLLIDGGRSVEALNRLDEDLGIKYLAIDQRQNRQFYDITYAGAATADASRNFESMYHRKEYDLYRLNNGTEMFRIPGRIIIDYAGFYSLYPVWKDEAGSDDAVIFADTDYRAADAFNASDTVVFGPHDAVFPRIDKSRVIAFDGYEREGDGCWTKVPETPSGPGSGVFRTDQWRYGEYLASSPSTPDCTTEGEADRVSQEFSIKESGDYEIFARVYMGRTGGNLTIGIDDIAQAGINTKSDIEGYRWVKVFDGHFNAGAKTFWMENEAGFQAVNMGYFLKKGGETESAAIAMDGALQGKRVMYVFDSNGDFESTNASPAYDQRFTRGMGMGLTNQSRLATSFRIYRAGIYQLTLKGTDVAAFIDGKGTGGDGIWLDSGTHRLEVAAIGGNDAQADGSLDYAIIKGGTQPPKQNAAIMSYERTGMSDYVVTVNSSGPYFMVFTEGYDSAWRASAGGIESSPVPVYASVNGFYINQTGVHKVAVYYGLQPWHNAGLVISGLGYLAVFIYLAREYVKKNKIGRRVAA
jgi:hypothetical protein